MTILRAVTPDFGHLAAVEAKMEGQIQGWYGTDRERSRGDCVCHSSSTHSYDYLTNIYRFYSGGLREKDVLTKEYVNSIYKVRLFLFHGISINILRDRFALYMNGQKIILSSIYGQQRDMD